MNIKLLILLFFSSFAYHGTAQQLDFGPKKENQGKLLDKIIAYVGTDTITQSELTRLRALSADKVSEAQILDELIIQKLLIQAAKRRNINVNDTMIDDAINRQAKNRGLSRSDLVSDLQAKEGVNFADYREQVRNQLMINALQQIVGRSLVDISEREVEDAISQNQKSGETIELIDIFLPLPAKLSTQQRQAKQALAQNIYASAIKSPSNLTRFNSNQVKVNRLGRISIKRIPSSFRRVITNTAIGDFTKPIRDRDGLHILKVVSRGNAKAGLNYTETQTKHILIRTDETISEKEAKRQIDFIKTLLTQGETFENLASQYSEDSQTAANGGSLGWVRPGQMAPEFEQVMNKTPVNQVSKPFRTQFGWHLIKVDARRQAKTDAAEQQRLAARAEIFNQRIEEAWALWVQRLRDEAYIKIVK